MMPRTKTDKTMRREREQTKLQQEYESLNLENSKNLERIRQLEERIREFEAEVDAAKAEQQKRMTSGSRILRSAESTEDAPVPSSQTATMPAVACARPDEFVRATDDAAQEIESMRQERDALLRRVVQLEEISEKSSRSDSCEASKKAQKSHVDVATLQQHDQQLEAAICEKNHLISAKIVKLTGKRRELSEKIALHAQLQRLPIEEKLAKAIRWDILAVVASELYAVWWDAELRTRWFNWTHTKKTVNQARRYAERITASNSQAVWNECLKLFLQPSQRVVKHAHAVENVFAYLVQQAKSLALQENLSAASTDDEWIRALMPEHDVATPIAQEENLIDLVIQRGEPKADRLNSGSFCLFHTRNGWQLKYKTYGNDDATNKANQQPTLKTIDISSNSELENFLLNHNTLEDLQQQWTNDRPTFARMLLVHSNKLDCLRRKIQHFLNETPNLHSTGLTRLPRYQTVMDGNDGVKSNHVQMLSQAENIRSNTRYQELPEESGPGPVQAPQPKQSRRSLLIKSHMALKNDIQTAVNNRFAKPAVVLDEKLTQVQQRLIELDLKLGAPEGAVPDDKVDSGMGNFSTQLKIYDEKIARIKKGIDVSPRDSELPQRGAGFASNGSTRKPSLLDDSDSERMQEQHSSGSLDARGAMIEQPGLHGLCKKLNDLFERVGCFMSEEHRRPFSPRSGLFSTVEKWNSYYVGTTILFYNDDKKIVEGLSADQFAERIQAKKNSEGNNFIPYYTRKIRQPQEFGPAFNDHGRKMPETPKHGHTCIINSLMAYVHQAIKLTLPADQLQEVITAALETAQCLHERVQSYVGEDKKFSTLAEFFKSLQQKVHDFQEQLGGARSMAQLPSLASPVGIVLRRSRSTPGSMLSTKFVEKQPQNPVQGAQSLDDARRQHQGVDASR